MSGPPMYGTTAAKVLLAGATISIESGPLPLNVHPSRLALADGRLF